MEKGSIYIKLKDKTVVSHPKARCEIINQQLFVLFGIDRLVTYPEKLIEEYKVVPLVRG
jgi:hypothetical protein